MKQFYTIFSLCLLSVTSLFAQTRYWVGADNANWNNINNWSATSGGAGGASIPDASGYDVVIDNDAIIYLDVPSFTINRLVITGTSDVKIYVTGDVDMTLASTSALDQALSIDAGSTLLDSTNGDYEFVTIFANDAKGTINGSWIFKTDSPNGLYAGPYFMIPGGAGLTNRLDVNGTIEDYFNAGVGVPASGVNYLFMNAGSTYHVAGNYGVVPYATWDLNSQILITGRTTTGMAFRGTNPLGNIVYNCPGQINSISFDLVQRTVGGNVDILNTNGHTVQLVGNGSGTTTTITSVIMGDLTISGNSVVNMSEVSGSNKTITLDVRGDLNAGGVDFNIQPHTQLVSTPNKPTTLIVGGNINHTAGTFRASSNIDQASLEFHVIEMKGTAPQTISSVTGEFSNPRNLITLRMNNAAGVTLLTPLKIGRISFATANRGILYTTTTNLLTLNNTSASGLTMNSPADLGHVNGPVQRRTASTSIYKFSIGKGNNLRQMEIVPETTAESFYTVEYFNTPFADMSVVPPLSGIANNEYYEVSRASGADASIRLFLDGAINGATADDAVVVGRYNGSDWINERGTTGAKVVPGNSTTGVASTRLLGTFGYFTLAYGTQEALPINLVRFTGRKGQGGSSILNWVVTSHSTPERFEVLRSSDGRNFVSLGMVSAASLKLQYDFTDAQMLKGNNFYRLKMYDQDGTQTLSRIITIMNGSHGLFMTSMMPTLVHDRARVNISSSSRGNIQLVVTDMHGRAVYSQSASIFNENQEVWLNLGQLRQGTYHVTGYFNGERTATIRFVKQ